MGMIHPDVPRIIVGLIADAIHEAIEAADMTGEQIEAFLVTLDRELELRLGGLQIVWEAERIARDAAGGPA